jgi:hypothetical protein
MSDSPPPTRYASSELAQKIAAHHGRDAKTVTVKMVGKKEVSDFLQRLQTVRQPAPTETFRVK